jgi:hypothetical protein
MTYNWRITDSSGSVFDNSLLKLYKNSIGVPITMMERSNIYTVEVNATDGNYVGYMKTYFYTEPEMSFEFNVEPNSGFAH